MNFKRVMYSYWLRPFRFIIPAILLLTAVACGQTSATPTPAEAATAVVTAAPTATPDALAYLDASLPVAERVEDLLTRMSLQEKLGQMTLVEKNSIQPRSVAEYGIGAILSGGGGYPEERNTPEEWAKMVNSYQEAALATPLGIPIIYGVDAVHGHNNLKGSVIFPHGIGLGATRNPELVEQVARITAVETTATGIPWNYAPVVAVPQDLRWGRTYEAFGEDPELVSELGSGYIHGLQGDDLSDPSSMLATPKHFVADGGTTIGSSETGFYLLDQGDTRVDEATLRAIHLPPYEAAVAAGAQSIMVSFSSWNGTKMHAQKYLLTDVLKNEFGFDGFLVSDWEAIDQISPDYYDAVVAAINAGVDMNMVPYEYLRFIRTMETAVADGDIFEQRVDDAVRRILTVKFNLGLFEHPTPEPAQLDLIGTAEHRAVAREAVSQSLVLLQNENNTLPIARDAKIFIAGPYADNIGAQAGGWTIEWQGRLGQITPGTTIKDGVERTGTGEISYDAYGRFDTSNPPADVGIVVIGEKPYAEGFGDAEDLRLTESDIALINRVREQADKVVVILLSGRPLIITEQLPLADAWVAAWLPGTEGQGIVDNLFGDHAFTGKLPYTWPASMDQLPLGSTDEKPLFPYGYGLTIGED